MRWLRRTNEATRRITTAKIFCSVGPESSRLIHNPSSIPPTPPMMKPMVNPASRLRPDHKLEATPETLISEMIISDVPMAR